MESAVTPIVMKKSLILLAAVLAASAAVQAQERFSTQETVVVTKPVSGRSGSSTDTTTSNSRTVRLRVGEVIEVFAFQDQFGVERKAFYLPIEGTRVAQVVMERQGRTDRYYLKGRSRGRTVGGVVPRAWLDASGFKPRNMADELRIQAVVRAHPVYIVVE